jgi:hypothetical protein
VSVRGNVSVDLSEIDVLGFVELRQLVLDEVTDALKCFSGSLQKQERLEYVHAILKYLVLDGNACE